MSVYRIGNKSSESPFPKIRPTLDLDFANSKTLDPRITFRRASGGSYFGPDGRLRYAGVNIPRFDHNPVTGECLGLLVEEQRTNLLLRSEEFDNASWTNVGMLAFGSGSTANAGIAPDGTTTADLLIESTDTNLERSIFRSGFTSSSAITLTVYAKAAGRSHVGLRFYAGTANWVRATFTLSGTGVASAVSAGDSSSYSATAASIEQWGNGWYRLRLTATRTAGTNFEVIDFATNASPVLNASSGREFYTGDGTSGLYIWGAQLEVGSFPTSYIPTTDSAATRSADVASIEGAAFSSWYRQDEGTIFANFLPGNLSANATVFEVGDNSLNNRINIEAQPGTSLRAWPRMNTANSLQIDIPVNNVLSLTAPTRAAVAFATNNSSFAANGTTGATDASCTIPVVDRAGIGQLNTDGARLNGTIRRLTYFPQRLSNSTLQRLTR